MVLGRSDIINEKILEENAIDMAQNGLLVEKKYPQVTQCWKKGLLVAMCPKANNPN